MSKYNEVMDNIKVSEEMRKRILGNIEKELGEGTLLQEADQAKDISKVTKGTEKTGSRIPINKEKIIRFITFYGSRAAVFLLIAAGTYGVIRTVGLKDNHPMSAPSSTMYEAENSYDAAAESAEDYAEAPAVYEKESEAPATYEEESEAPATYGKDSESADMFLTDADGAAETAWTEPATEEAAETVGTESVTEEAAETVRTEPITDGDLKSEDQNGLGSAQESNMAAENAAGSTNKAAKAQDDVPAIADSSYATETTSNIAASVSEMSEKLGYDVEGLSFFAENSSEVEYSYCSEGGEITYHTEYGTIHLYASDKGVFTGNSGSAPGSFEAMKQIDTGAKMIDAFGEEDNYTTLIWRENGITYVIVSEKGLSEDLINKMF